MHGRDVHSCQPLAIEFLAALPSSSNENATVVVTIPSGIAAWTGQINYSVPSSVTNLTIQGATTVNCSGTAGAAGYTCSASDSTVIEDAYASNNPPLVITLGGASTHFRMTGLTFQGGNIGSSSYNKYNCIVNFSGASQNFRVNHLHFNNNTYTPAASSSMVRIGGSIEGVMDHNIVNLGNNSSDANGFQTFNDIGDSIGNGDGAFVNPTGWGSSAHSVHGEQPVQWWISERLHRCWALRYALQHFQRRKHYCSDPCYEVRRWIDSRMPRIRVLSQLHHEPVW